MPQSIHSVRSPALALTYMDQVARDKHWGQTGGMVKFVRSCNNLDPYLPEEDVILRPVICKEALSLVTYYSSWRGSSCCSSRSVGEAGAVSSAKGVRMISWRRRTDTSWWHTAAIWNPGTDPTDPRRAVVGSCRRRGAP